MTHTALNAKIREFEIKYQMLGGLVTNTALNTKIREVEKKIQIMINILPLMILINFQVETFLILLSNVLSKMKKKTEKLQTL